MQYINDFFLTSWHEKIEFETSIYESFEFDSENFIDECSIVLSANRNNVSRFEKVDFFQKRIQGSGFRVQELQFVYLSRLGEIASLEMLEKVKENLNKLQKHSIITYEENQNIQSILNLIKPYKKEVQETQVYETFDFEEGEDFYHTNINKLNTVIKNLLQLTTSQSLTSQLNNITNNLENSKFSIGVTGVMNSGKSTMLNAILGEDILGTSMVPETANLSIIKYDKNNDNKVNISFWNKQEWSFIENSNIPSTKEFVSETKNHFGSKLDEFIQDSTKTIQTNIENLASYTSAQNSDKKCNLVKSVDIFSDLKFVKNGVLIVDTPGLDDPVIQREEITKQYLASCDVLIHLMNVNQSATKKRY